MRISKSQVQDEYDVWVWFQSWWYVPRSSTQLKQMSGSRTPNLSTLTSVKVGSGGGGRAGSFQNFTKDLGWCSASWRAVAIFFIVLTIAMASTLAFVLASTLVTSPPSQTEIAAACAVVDSGPSEEKTADKSLKHGPGNTLQSSQCGFISCFRQSEIRIFLMFKIWAQSEISEDFNFSNSHKKKKVY